MKRLSRRLGRPEIWACDSSVNLKWKVGGPTHQGEWPIYIACDLKDRSGALDTSITVK